MNFYRGRYVPCNSFIFLHLLMKLTLKNNNGVQKAFVWAPRISVSLPSVFHKT